MGKFGMRDPIAYVIAFEKDDGVRSYHGSPKYDGQAVLRYYPSPFDALIDTSRNCSAFVESGRSITVYPVEALRPRFAKAQGNQAVIACLQVAWRARSGKLMIRPDGTPDSVLSSSPELESGSTVLELPLVLVRLVDEIREQAGLFAWKEIAQTFDDCSKGDQQALAQQAWRSAPVIESDGPDPDFDQFAVYDPEFRQWHFVPAIEVIASP